jgi:DNA-binding transcriptional regulator YhcF (GntR family)
MQFKESQAIYLQIADYVCEQVLLKEWKTDERIPSVRELAVQLEVNPNTVMRTFDFLLDLLHIKMHCSTAKKHSVKKIFQVFSATCIYWEWNWMN